MHEELDQIRRQIKNPEKGLPEELFLFATEITPMINVDLLVRDDAGRILLSWRDDRFYGKGWHVPGGIIRLKETLVERIERTSFDEIGSIVEYDENPLEIVQIICPEMKLRGHFITLVYDCWLLDNIRIDNKERTEGTAGYLKWHEKFPDDMLKVHHFYRKYFQEGEVK